ncbi:hypothetical protein [Priestia koreensis]|uniref:hypothetical protein n=1 Tax=Priestia koreensis TaxID=284581 RepID=UPI001F5AB637|nr:hypothetical protein [Priestia koreensis]UNL86825.1 hypothetical protein IE339_10170 [Priestia koreensis]
MNQTMKVVTLTLLTLGLVFGGGAFVLFSMLLPDKFDQDRWNNHPEERVDMVDNLLEEVTLKGKTKSEITTLLGKQDPKAYFKKPTNLVYYLGDERGIFSIDSEWLIISFSDKGIVDHYEVTTD